MPKGQSARRRGLRSDPNFTQSTLYIHRAVLAELQDRAKAKGISASEIANRAILAHLKSSR